MEVHFGLTHTTARKWLKTLTEKGVLDIDGWAGWRNFLKLWRLGINKQGMIWNC